MDESAARLQQRILNDIPLARHIGIRVLEQGADSLQLGASLEPNANHKGTAFGGSLFSLAVLAGWGLLTLKLARLGVTGDIVIQDSKVNYLRPVTGDFTALASVTDAGGFDRLVRTLSRRGRGRIRLRSIVEHEGRTAVEFEGTFAVVRGTTP